MTGSNIITFFISFDEGEISLVYNVTDNTFDYTELMILHDLDNVMSNGVAKVDAAVYMYLDNASLNITDGTFHGTGGLVMYAHLEDLNNQASLGNLIKYGDIETYRGGLDLADDIGTGTFLNSGSVLSDPLDVNNFNEDDILGPINKPIATYKDYFDEVVVSPEFGNPSPGEYESFVVYRKDSDSSFVFYSLDTDNHEIRKTFFETNVPDYWQTNKLLDFPTSTPY